MKIKLGKRSKLNLCNNLDYRLCHIVCEVIKKDLPCDFGVFETKRTLEKQKEYFEKGTSKTMNSKHLPDKNGIVRAMDIVPYVEGSYVWESKYLDKIIPIFKEVAKELYGNEIEFGYDWGWDKPHIEIRNGYEI